MVEPTLNLDMMRLAERLGRARLAQARTELSHKSEMEANSIAHIWIEGDLGRALACASIEEARRQIETQAARAEAAAQSQEAKPDPYRVDPDDLEPGELVMAWDDRAPSEVAGPSKFVRIDGSRFRTVCAWDHARRATPEEKRRAGIEEA